MELYRDLFILIACYSLLLISAAIIFKAINKIDKTQPEQQPPPSPMPKFISKPVVKKPLTRKKNKIVFHSDEDLFRREITDNNPSDD